MRNTVYALLGTAALTLAAFVSAATPVYAKDGDVRLRCRAKGANHIELRANFESRVRSNGPRQKFSAEFEARAGGGFVSGQQIAVVVDTVAVGNIVLTPESSGELSGELEFDSKAQNGHTPFPANFPDVAAGSTVDAVVGGSTVLGCDLQ